MKMKYLKVFTDFAEVIAPLGDAEIGRMFKAMLEYAETGTEPDFRGNERFIWPAAKQNIDRTATFNEKQKNNGALGGRPKTQNNPTKPKETQNNPTKPNKSLKDKDKDKDKDKENISPNGDNTRAPSLDEIKSYAESRNSTVDPVKFFEYFNTPNDKGQTWTDSKGAKVRNWKQKFLTWERFSTGGKEDVRRPDSKSAGGYDLSYD